MVYVLRNRTAWKAKCVARGEIPVDVSAGIAQLVEQRFCKP